MKTKLSPSMLSIDFGKVAEQLKLVEDAGTQYILFPIFPLGFL